MRERQQANYRCQGCGSIIYTPGLCDYHCARRTAQERRQVWLPYRLRLWVNTWATPVAGVVIVAVLLLSAWVMP